MEDNNAKKILQFEHTISKNKRIIKRKKKSFRYVISGLFLFHFALYYFGEEYLFQFFGGRLDFINALFYSFGLTAIAYAVWLYFYLRDIRITSKKLNEKMYHLMKLKK